MINNGDKYLVTSDSWFMTPSGEQARAAWGTCIIMTAEETFGFKPQRPSTNWFLKIGSEDKHIIIGGCQIHHVIRSETRPDELLGKTKDSEYGREFPDNKIYFAE